VNQPEIDIIELSSLEHYERCVEIQLATWGYGGTDVVPMRLFRVAERIGGQVLGGFDGDTMVSFTMAWPGIRDGVPYLHSHMLAVLPEYRNHGIGRRMKLAQRDAALERGIERMEWTFDPLQIGNAQLNIARLGAIARRYEADFYGPSSSPLQGGLPTDRLVAEWWLRSPHVEWVLRGSPPQGKIVERVEVPATVYEWKKNPELRSYATDLQTRNREVLQSAFARGLAIAGYELDDQRNGTFLLRPANEISL
jgi:predicted GNAT superfamily acetyltransferase